VKHRDELPDRSGLRQRAVRVLPPHLAAEAIEATRTVSGTARPARLLRPERLDHVADLVRLVQAGEAIVLQVDQLDEGDQLRALDVATGVAAALDATLVKLDTTPGVSISPRDRTAHAAERSVPAHVAEDTRPGPVPPPAPTSPPTRVPSPEREISVCVLCELRPATLDLDPPLDSVLKRDGSRQWAPRIGICDRCQRTVRNWRFAVAWCSQCERWGRRGVRSPCKLAYGS
jgi:Cell division protein SepF